MFYVEYSFDLIINHLPNMSGLATLTRLDDPFPFRSYLLGDFQSIKSSRIHPPDPGMILNQSSASGSIWINEQRVQNDVIVM